MPIQAWWYPFIDVSLGFHCVGALFCWPRWRAQRRLRSQRLALHRSAGVLTIPGWTRGGDVDAVVGRRGIGPRCSPLESVRNAPGVAANLQLPCAGRRSPTSRWFENFQLWLFGFNDCLCRFPATERRCPTMGTPDSCRNVIGWKSWRASPIRGRKRSRTATRTPPGRQR